MKVSELWLRNIIDPPCPITDIANQLANGGIEVDQCETDPGTKQAILTLKIPPNRGDCLSMEGIAREISVFNDMAYQPMTVSPIMASIEESFPLRIDDRKDCPHYIGCVVKNINNTEETPEWLKVRLETAGIRSISAVVDIMNYVMLELGQPLHAFDLSKLDKEIVVRKSIPGEKISLLDGQAITLEPNILVVADKTKAQAVAGVMGGSDSAVTPETTTIWIESAYFDPIAIRLSAQKMGLKTDASHRFERGVDPTLQKRAVERALQLIMEITGGKPGPLVIAKSTEYLPKIPTIFLRKAKIPRILGMEIENKMIVNFLQRLGMQVIEEKEGFKVSPPPFRADITLEIDLIEEIARVYGFHRLGTEIPITTFTYSAMERKIAAPRLKEFLADRGYYEAINYSFIDPKWIEIFDPNVTPLQLANPIAANMAAMRTSLWPGLLQAVQYNQRRQHARLRFFEIGTCFIEDEGKLVEKEFVSGIATGSLYKEQWCTPMQPLDFYDIKGDVEALCALSDNQTFSMVKGERTELHPGQTAKVLYEGKTVGYVGSLHPRIIRALALEGPIFVFELEMASLQTASIKKFHPLSKFPMIRRDIAILIDKTIFAAELRSAIMNCAGEVLQEVIVFDVYQGKGIEPGKKSIALALILQHASHTLIDEEVNEIVQEIVNMLSSRFQAVLRE